MQLFFLHFAGGNCYSYDFLKQYLEPGLSMLSLELPGRGKRHDEPCLISKKAAVEDYLCQIERHLEGQPYIIFGHSMGATLGLSVTKRLEEIGKPPSLLVVSGNAGPKLNAQKAMDNQFKRMMHQLSFENFREELRGLGGIPFEVLDNDDAFRFFAPIIRADFQILETGENDDDIKITTPIYALMGSKERRRHQIANWERFTSGGLRCRILEGNHFFIYNNAATLAFILANQARRVNCNSKDLI
jgi:surfactin synthase thioesterase subunit